MQNLTAICLEKNSVFLFTLYFKYKNNTLCSFVALMRRATVHSHLQNYQAAIEDLNEVLSVEPENSRAKVKISELNMARKRLYAVVA